MGSYKGREQEMSDNQPKANSDVEAISYQDIAQLGVHKKTGRLYWRGKEVATRSILDLAGLPLLFAGLAAAGSFGSFLVNLARGFGLLK
jgi:hypothetical protein